MGCCSWFDLFFSQDSKQVASKGSVSKYAHCSSQEHLLVDEDGGKLFSVNEEVSPTSLKRRDDEDDYVPPTPERYENEGKNVPSKPASNGFSRILAAAALDASHRNVSYDNLAMASSNSHHIWRPRHIKYSRCAIRGEDCSGKKMINNYVKERTIGIGSYSKVVLCQNIADEMLYAMKVVQKSRLRKIKVAPSETALTDVYKEVSIMKELDHPNIVKLIEVIDDPESDRLYMILEYVDGRCMFEGPGPDGGIGEAIVRRYFRDMVAGLMYLHSRRIIHGDIKPENLLISVAGQVKICDFSVSQRFQGNNDELRRSPGTPVFTAPECITGATYRGRLADIWALGVTLYCMVFGRFPFIGDTLQGTYDEIVQGPLEIPEDVNPKLANLLELLLCKDPAHRLTLDEVVEHPFLMEDT